MELKKIEVGATGIEAANIIYANDMALSDRIDGISTGMYYDEPVNTIQELPSVFPLQRQGLTVLVKTGVSGYPDGAYFQYNNKTGKWINTGMSAIPSDVALKGGTPSTLKQVEDLTKTKADEKTVTNELAKKANSETVTGELTKKADLTKPDGSAVLYTDKNGKIPDNVLSAATIDQNGLMSKEHVKQLNENSNEILKINEDMKTYAEKYNTAVTFFFKNTADKIGNINSLCELMSNSSSPITYIKKSGDIEHKSETSAKKQRVWHQFTKENEQVTLYLSGAFHIQSMYMSDISFISISSSSPETTQFFFNNQKIKTIDVSGFASAKYLNGNSSDIDSLHLYAHENLETLALENCPNLIAATINGKKTISFYANGSPKFNSFGTVNDMSELIRFHADGTAITKSAIMTNLEPRWLSRVGKTAGVLKLNLSLLNEMTAEEKKKFTDKNITLQF